MRAYLGSALSCLVLPFLLGAAPAWAQDYGYSGGTAASVNIETRLSSVEDQMRALTGKVEQIEFAVRRMDQALQRSQSDTEMRLSKLENAPPPVTQQQAAPSVAANPDAEEIDTTGTLGALKMRGGSVTGGVNKPKTPPLPNTPADYGLTPQEQYDRAFGLLRQASYDDAEKAFKSFIEKNPKDKLTDNAKYWYAETFYVRGKFGDAAVSFAEAFESNPKSQKAPDSLLKLAMSLGSLNKTDDACATLIALKNKFPTAPATIRARADQERTHLKCSAKGD